MLTVRYEPLSHTHTHTPSLPLTYDKQKTKKKIYKKTRGNIFFLVLKRKDGEFLTAKTKKNTHMRTSNKCLYTNIYIGVYVYVYIYICIQYKRKTKT